MSKVYFAGTLIAASDPTYGRVGPSGISGPGGQAIIDVANFIRAEFATLYGRGRGPKQFSFRTTALFTTQVQVLQFVTLFADTLPVQDDLELVDDDGTTAVIAADAICDARIERVIGLSVDVAYQFTLARFESEDVPEFPSDTANVKAFNQALTNGTTSVDIAFDSAFASAPRGISLQLSAPDAGAMFGLQIRESSRTSAGFTVDFDAAVPASGYKITGIAAL